MSNDSAAIVSNPRPLRVFLCHSSTDKPAVRELYQRLKADGFAPWLDEEDLLPGQDWQREIPKAVRNSDIVIVCLSPSSINKAGYVQKEIKFALDVADEQPEDYIYIIPLRLVECAVPERLRRLHWVNMFEQNGYTKLVRSLSFRATQAIKALDATEQDGRTRILSHGVKVGPADENWSEQPIPLSPQVRKIQQATTGYAHSAPPVRTVKVVISRSGDGPTDAQRVGEVHQAMSACPGPDKFCFIIMARGSFYQMDFPNDSTTLNDELITYLKSMPGVESVQVSIPYGQGQS
jgi:hypothetical protein